GNGKLSKRDGDRLGFPVFPLEWKDPVSGEINSGYREKGFFPQAFVNMLALLGWTPPGEQEIMGLDEMARAFQLEKVHKAGSKYNYEKACWFNQQYLHQNSVAELAALFLPILEEKGLNPKGFGTDEEAKSGSENYLTRVVSLIKDRCTLIPDLWDQSRFFFQRPDEYEAEPVKKKWDASKETFFDKVIDLFESDPGLWNTPATEQAGSAEPDHPESVPGEYLLEEKFKALMQAEGMKPGEVMLPLRVMLTGGRFGPAVFTIAALLGQKETIQRIRLALPSFK
ncbi:MAG TPA: glutamate--tRNA ligase family protein, partial [Anseongella sp.]